MSVIFELDPKCVHEAPDNPNRMDPARFADLKRAITELGFLQPILVRTRSDGEYEVVDGHHRMWAARELKLPTIPAVLFEGTREGAQRLAQIGMNRLRGELDMHAVGVVFDELLRSDWEAVELTIAGFSDADLHALISAVQDDTTRLTEDVLASAPAMTPEPAPPSPFKLEIEFSDMAQMKKCRAALKRAAGRGGAMSLGLLRLIGEVQ